MPNMFENIMTAREARLRSPGFQAEMAREKTEFKEIAKNLGNNTLDTGYTTLLGTPLKLFSNGLKTIYKKKYGAGAYMQDSFKLFFGKNGVFHGALKVGANATHLAGKSAKIGLRYLFAK